MAFPRLRFTEYVFYKALVPTVEFIHDNVCNVTAMSPGEIILLIPFLILFVCFPVITHQEEIFGFHPSKTKSREKQLTDQLLIASDSESDTAGELNIDDEIDDNTEEIGGDFQTSDDENDVNTSIFEFLQSESEANSTDSKIHPSIDDSGPHSLRSDSPMSKDDEKSVTNEDFSVQNAKLDDAAFVSNPSPLVDSVLDENPKYDSPSRVLRSFRKLLAGDSNARLSETVFNLDLHSPPTNTQYRNRRRSEIPMEETSGKHEDNISYESIKSSKHRESCKDGISHWSCSIFKSPNKKHDMSHSSEPPCYSPLHKEHFGDDEVTATSQADSKNYGSSKVTLRQRRSESKAKSAYSKELSASKSGSHRVLRSSSKTVDQRQLNVDKDNIETASTQRKSRAKWR